MTAWEVVSVAGAEPRPLPRVLLEPPPPVVWFHGKPRPGDLHPSPFLASKGWEMSISGVWIRRNGAGNAVS